MEFKNTINFDEKFRQFDKTNVYSSQRPQNITNFICCQSFQYSDYLRAQKLDKAAEQFCKTSPYLRSVHDLSKQGHLPVRLGAVTLLDILKEFAGVQQTRK